MTIKSSSGKERASKPANSLAIANQKEYFQRTSSVWSRNLSTSDALGRSVQVVKHVLHGKGKNLASNTVGWETGLHSNQVVGLLHRLDDGLDVQRLDAAKVDDLRLDTVLRLEGLGGGKGLADTAGEGHEGDILANTLNLGLAELRIVRNSRGCILMVNLQE